MFSNADLQAHAAGQPTGCASGSPLMWGVTYISLQRIRTLECF